MNVERRSLQDEALSLPDFDKPPVVEVAFSIAFDPLPRVTASDLGALWQLHYRPRGFEFTSDQPRIRVMPEQFGVLMPSPGLQVEVVTQVEVPRMWFRNESGTGLVQVQNDWFARNWRKLDSGEEYPRYGTVRQSFGEDFRQFQQFVQSEKLGQLTPTQCELTYVNQIGSEGGSDAPARLEELLRVTAADWNAPFLPKPELTRLATQFVIPGETAEPVGRLYVTAEPAFRKTDSASIILLTLTARGRLPGEGIERALDFFDLGHRWIVLGFVDLTTERMHRVWGLRHGNS